MNDDAPATVAPGTPRPRLITARTGERHIRGNPCDQRGAAASA